MTYFNILKKEISLFLGSLFSGTKELKSLGFTLLIILGIGGWVQAKELVQPALSIQGMTQEQQRVYLDGLADGFQILNAKLQRQGQSPLYCIPEKVVILGRDLLEFAAEDLQGPQEDLTIAVSGLLGLIERYPCPKENVETPLPAKTIPSK
ncbi:hypothetical protein [Candidatus Nitronereus thalassa]|uniref:Rap1a immunity protein domain-containing protein n=1 Tax=Candidatus Nitronereus thalassa TaxID=3020898 RepID=A0ABU3K7Z2_9BACT|nr:hypothetical protein [Candidatus Nitronereus thalassa]MDT7042500.1 hypothetical protein [Candidatus Nitronereus thalassa]